MNKDSKSVEPEDFPLANIFPFSRKPVLGVFLYPLSVRLSVAKYLHLKFLSRGVGLTKPRHVVILARLSG
jgi:hypothetical protein